MANRAIFIYDVYELTLSVRAAIWTEASVGEIEYLMLGRDIDRLVEDWFRLVLSRTNSYLTEPLYLNCLPHSVKKAFHDKRMEFETWIYRVIRVPMEYSMMDVEVRLWRNDLYLIYKF